MDTYGILRQSEQSTILTSWYHRNWFAPAVFGGFEEDNDRFERESTTTVPSTVRSEAIIEEDYDNFDYTGDDYGINYGEPELSILIAYCYI